MKVWNFNLKKEREREREKREQIIHCTINWIIFNRNKCEWTQWIPEKKKELCRKVNVPQWRENSSSRKNREIRPAGTTSVTVRSFDACLSAGEFSHETLQTDPRALIRRRKPGHFQARDPLGKTFRKRRAETFPKERLKFIRTLRRERIRQIFFFFFLKLSGKNCLIFY